MVWIIEILNKNNYPVIDASLESNSIYILFDKKCRFPKLPPGFSFNSVEKEGEYAILINYSEPNINKTAEELDIIKNNIFEWVKTFCKM